MAVPEPMAVTVCIETPRLILRTVTLDDLTQVAAAWNLYGGPVSPQEAEDAINQMASRRAQNRPGRVHHLCLAMVDRASGEIVGWCGLDGTAPERPHPVLFYLLADRCWGRGLATEAARALLEYAFTALGLEQVDSGAIVTNLASKKVMEKCGMRDLGPDAQGNFAFTLTRDEYFRANPARIGDFNMNALTSRAYQHPGDFERLAGLLRRAREAGQQEEFPDLTSLHELMAMEGVAERTRLWDDAQGEPAAFSLVDPWSNLWFEALPGAWSPALEDAFVAWGVQCVGREAESLDTNCSGGNAARMAMLARHGFVEQPGRTLELARDLALPIPPASFPPGFTVRAASGEGEVEALAALHRAAFGTDVMTTEYRLAMMRAPGYDPALDLLAVAPNGELAAFCVGGIDPESGGAEGAADPVGTHPAYRRRGLARALLLEALARLKQRGAISARMTTTSENAAMLKAAASVGFAVVREKVWFSKPLG